jgi:hypothetical protein
MFSLPASEERTGENRATLLAWSRLWDYLQPVLRHRGESRRQIGGIMGHQAYSVGHGHSHSHSQNEQATRRAFLSSIISAAVLAPWAFGQEQTPADTAQRFRKMSEDYEREGLADPFKGITTNGSVRRVVCRQNPCATQPRSSFRL